MTNIWELSIKQKQGKLPAIIPILIYHGPKRWTVGLKLTDILEETPTQLKVFIPDYKYILYDLSMYTEEDIKGEIKLRLFFELLTGIFKADFEERCKKILYLMEEMSKKEAAASYIETVIRYIMGVKEGITLQRLAEIAKETSKEKKRGGGEVMTIAEQLINEGYRERAGRSLSWSI